MCWRLRRCAANSGHRQPSFRLVSPLNSFLDVDEHQEITDIRGTGEMMGFVCECSRISDVAMLLRPEPARRK